MWMYLSSFLFALMGLTVKALATRIPSDEIAFYRSVLPALMLAPTLWRDATSRPDAFRRSLPLMLLRGLLGSCALLLYFRAISLIHFSNAAMLSYTSPIFTAILAAVFLGEKLSRRGVIACFVAIAGVALVIRPTLLFGGQLPPHVVEGTICGLVGGVMAAGAYTSVRRLTESASPMTIVAVFSWVASLCSMPLMLRHYVAPTALEWGGLLAMALFANFAQIFMTMGYRDMPASRASTQALSVVVFATLLGFVFFAEKPDVLDLVGLAVTLFGISLVGSPATPTPDATVVAGEPGEEEGGAGLTASSASR